MSNWPLKAVCVSPALVSSTALVTFVGGPALPVWAGNALFCAGLLIVGALLVGVGEPTAVRLLFAARKLDGVERTALAPVVTELCHFELGPPLVTLLVSRRHGLSAAAIAQGRRTIVLSPELVHAIVTRRMPPAEAIAVVAHACLVARSGLNRQNPAIAFWSTPWRMLSWLVRPLGPLVGFAWRIRVIVAGVAIWQSATTVPATRGAVTGGAVAILLALTYLLPRWSTSWERLVAGTGDRELIPLGLAPGMISFLRRCPQTMAVIERLQLLDRPAIETPRLRLVGS